MPEYRALRVLRAFKWAGWHYAPANGCKCSCADPQTHTYYDPEVRHEVTVTMDGPVSECPRRPGQDCRCNRTVCGCCCGMPANSFGGDILVTDVGQQLERQEGRINAIVTISRFAVPDLTAQETAITPNGEVKPEYQRLLRPPEAREMAVSRSRSKT